MENEIRELVGKWVSAWNSNDLTFLTEIYHENAVLYQAPMKKLLSGREHIIDRYKDFVGMSSDSKIKITELHISHDHAILELNVTGTHNGKFLDYEPTGLKFDIDTCLILRIWNGMITKHTTYLDTASILRAIGVIKIAGAKEEAA